MGNTSESYVELARSGGQVPTYRPVFRIDVSALTSDQRVALDSLLNSSAFFGLPQEFSKLRHADAFEYRLTVNVEGRSHTVTFSDQDGHTSSLDELADWIRAHRSG